ncbi:hypothetical protein AAC387_Pa03g0388 [Persea americana]
MISARFDERFLEILDFEGMGGRLYPLSSKERMLCPSSPDTCSCILGTERQGQWHCTSKAKRLDQEAMARSLADYCEVGN